MKRFRHKILAVLAGILLCGGLITTPVMADSSDPTCYDGGGLLGWILCPVLDAAAGATSGIYDLMIKPFLTIDPVLLSGSTGNGNSNTAYTAWATFRNFANIIFIIALLVVIFSQLTGVGISNFGIKKMLPKIVVMAILINLSFILCELAVDISNILGVAIKSLFDNLAGEVKVDSVGIGGASIVADITIGAVEAVAVVALAKFIVGAIGPLAASAGMTVLLPLILSIITMLIGIIFTFVLLGVRQAAVVILVVISPLAFACYALPNTKGLFDKWLKMFKAMLVMFPVAGALMGGGNFASKIILAANPSGDNFFLVLVAMLLNIIPLFFLPTLLKKSIASIDGIGAKLSTIGDVAKSKANAGIKGSNLYKNGQEQMQMRSQQARMQTLANTRSKWAGKGGPMGAIAKSGMMTRAIGRNAQASLATEQKNNTLAKYADPGYQAAMRAQQEQKLEDDAVAAEIVNMRGETANYDRSTMTSQLSTLLNQTSLTSSQTMRARALMSQLASGGGGDKAALAATMAGAGSQAGRQLAAGYGMSNASVKAAVKGNAAANEFLSKINTDMHSSDQRTAEKAGENGFPTDANGKLDYNSYIQNNGGDSWSGLSRDADAAAADADLLKAAIKNGAIDDTRIHNLAQNASLMEANPENAALLRAADTIARDQAAQEQAAQQAAYDEVQARHDETIATLNSINEQLSHHGDPTPPTTAPLPPGYHQDHPDGPILPNT